MNPLTIATIIFIGWFTLREIRFAKSCKKAPVKRKRKRHTSHTKFISKEEWAVIKESIINND